MRSIAGFPALSVGKTPIFQPQSGELVAKGAEVDVNVTFTCPAGDTVANPFGMGGGLNVSVQQAVSKTMQGIRLRFLRRRALYR